MNKISKWNLLWILLLIFYIYKSFIFYHIAFNPIKDLYNSQPKINYARLRVEYSDVTFHRTAEANSSAHNEILKYFANKKMLPLKNYLDEDIDDYGNSSEYKVLVFSLGEPYNNYIDIHFESPRVVWINSDGIIRDGYYKFLDGDIDFVYINNTLNENHN